MNKKLTIADIAEKNDFFPIHNRHETTRIKIKDILYMDKERRLLHIHMCGSSGDKTYTIYGKIEDYAEYFDDGFYRIHKSCLININKVSSMHDGEIFMEEGHILRIGINKYQLARKYFYNYMKEKSER